YLDDPKEYRLIIDSLLNLPLLFEASEISDKNEYKDVGIKHYSQVISNIIRADFSTCHTFYFDPVSGNPLHGATSQGYSDDSCWSRGQAWILLGMPLYKKYFPATNEKNLYQNILNYYLQHIPEDAIPYWDLIFTDSDKEPKDSSAAAIMACGMLEAKKQDYESKGDDIAKGILKVLSENYATQDYEDGLLKHGVYSYASSKGIDEANLWGDYFYMEALMRLYNPDWGTYW
ncbi:glycoside hydrolase family 88 protein, partial [Latilactobacillus fuchuensis]